MKIPIKTSAGLFWIFVLLDITGIVLNQQWLHYTVKPLLMPALLLLLAEIPFTASGKKMIFTGLIFAWLGDIFLLLEANHPIFFVIGLCSFLLTHICYIAYFLSIQSPAPSLLKKHPLLILLVTAYCIGLFVMLLPNLGQLTIPVLVYAIVIGCMLLSSMHIYLKIKKPANNYFLIGALLFVLSDSILAINKFYAPVLLGGVWVMVSYCAAQYCIVMGLIKNYKG